MPGQDVPGSAQGPSDGQLVRALREERDVTAFETLMKRYQRPIYGFIRRQIGDRSRADELFQETFVRVYSQIATCHNPDSFRPWAFAIAANLCRNEVRQQGRAVPSSGPRLDGTPGQAPDPEREAMSAETRRRIEEALQAMIPAQREVFILYHFTQLSYDEIAAVLNVPLGTVKSRMNAALGRLRTELEALREG
jgi:RNA polymerase sigma-70 factor, ECF subfamily